MLTLFAQYFVPKTKKRQDEIFQCFEKNIENNFVENFIILFEREEHMKIIPNHKKIKKKLLPDRITYAYWLKETEKLKSGTLSILINSDIYLTDSVNHLIENAKVMQEQKRFLALTRYNPVIGGVELNSNPHWTQDTWGIVKTDEPLPIALLQEAAFELGQPGCDNKIAYVMHSYGYVVTNPCLKVCTVHLQENAVRSYESKGSKLIGLHAFVHPTHTVLEDSELDFDLLTRSQLDPVEIRVNNWINSRKSYELIAKGVPSRPIKVRNKEVDGALTLSRKISYCDIKTSTPTPSSSSQLMPVQKFSPANYRLIAKFSERFAIYADVENLYYYDKYWPNVRIQRLSDLVGISLDDKNPILFAEAFLPIVLEVGDSEISADMQYLEDIMFWQFPCRTEGDAFDVHKAKKIRSYQKNEVNVYLPLPWATFIDKKKFPIVHLKILSGRISAAKKIIEKLGYILKVHTTCQHIRWRELKEWLPKIGITDLWISHKEKGLDELAGVRLHPWTLYAVNYCDRSRSRGLVFKRIDQKKTFASFIGAHMNHYPTDVRLRLNNLKDLPGYTIEIKDLWHFNKVVYKYQVFGQEKEKNSIQVDDVVRYNEVISDSIFSLCPAGAGPNTLRLWESLAIGSIPVILSDKHELPGPNENYWSKAVIRVSEDDIDKLDAILRRISLKELNAMQENCISIYNSVVNKTCFL